MAVFSVAAGSSVADLSASLRADDAVLDAGPVGRTLGAKSKPKSKKENNGNGNSNGQTTDGTTTDGTTTDGTTTDGTTTDGTTDGVSTAPAPSTNPTLRGLQWHIDSVATPEGTDLSGITVAVLDSGAAIQTERVRGTTYTQAPSLANVQIVAPKDFVDDDDLPLDEHQHGTHIATLLLGQGELAGVAAGAKLMPLRVLNSNNAGSEVELIDALDWAVRNGADVVNMSLSFPPGYVPSSALQRAIRQASDAGLVLVAAAGNDGLSTQVSWPAASPLVLSVGAYNEGEKWVEPSTYSNLGPAIDLMAPGGQLETDSDGDGIPDGILGESFALGHPDQLEPWLMAGSSQAAAVVSGAAVHLLAAGADANQVRNALLAGATDWGNKSAEWGVGAGGLDIAESLAMLTAGVVPAPERPLVAILPYVESEVDETGEEEVKARFRLTVTDKDGIPLDGHYVIQASLWSTDGHSTVECNLGSDGQCTLKSDSTERLDNHGDERPLAWALQVESVVDRDTNIALRPDAVLFGSDSLEVLLQGIDNIGTLRKAPLAVHWSAGDDPELGWLADSYAVIDSGSGLSSSPLGLAFLPSAMNARVRDYDVDLDGTGLSSSPLGVVSVQRLVMTGPDKSDNPMGFVSGKLVAIDGTGLSSSPLGLSAMDLTQPGPMVDLGLGLNGTRLLMGESMVVGGSSAGSLTADKVADGGWTLDGGYGVASILIGSGVVDVGTTAEGSGSGVSSQSMPLGL